MSSAPAAVEMLHKTAKVALLLLKDIQSSLAVGGCASCPFGTVCPNDTERNSARCHNHPVVSDLAAALVAVGTLETSPAAPSRLAVMMAVAPAVPACYRRATSVDGIEATYWLTNEEWTAEVAGRAEALIAEEARRG